MIATLVGARAAASKSSGEQALLDRARRGATMPFKLETKAHQATYDVDHRTLKSSAGGLMGDAKLEYFPNFTIRGSPLEFQIRGTEQTLLQPKQGKDLVAEAKCKVRPGLAATARYAVAKRLAGYNVKAVSSHNMPRLL